MSILTLHNDLATYLVIGAVLFGMGVYGMVTRRTLIGMLIAAELLLSGASINFMAFNRFICTRSGSRPDLHPVHHGHRRRRGRHRSQYYHCILSTLQID